MEFKLSCVDGSITNYKNKLQENGYDVYEKVKQREYDDYYLVETVKYDMFIQIETLDDLLNIGKILDSAIIIFKDGIKIEIYDGYRE